MGMEISVITKAPLLKAPESSAVLTKMGFHCLFVHCKCKHVDKLLLENKTVSLCVSFNNVVISFIFDLFVLFALVLCVID